MQGTQDQTFVSINLAFLSWESFVAYVTLHRQKMNLSPIVSSHLTKYDADVQGVSNKGSII